MNKHNKYKANNRHKVKAQNRALYVYHEPQECSIKNCDEIGERHHPEYDDTETIIWLCRKHHRQIHGFIKTECTIINCCNWSHAKGLCKNHYAQKFRKVQGW